MSAPTPTPHDPWPAVFDLGTIALLNGSPNAGKTALLAALLERISTGGQLFGHPIQPTPVFFIAMDRLWEKGASTWFRRQGFDIPHYSFVDDLSVPADSIMAKYPWQVYTDALEKLQLAPGTFICADPFTNAFGDVMDRRKVIAGSWHLQRYLHSHQLAQLGMMHSAKMKNDPNERYANVHEQMAGSGALSGYSSAQISLLSAKQTQSKRYELHITSHALPAMVYQLDRDERGLFRIDDATVVEGLGAPAPPVTPVLASTPGIRPEYEAIVQCLPDPPGSAKREQLAMMFADMPVRTLEDILRRMRDDGLISSPRKGYYQRTPKAKALIRGEGSPR